MKTLLFYDSLLFFFDIESFVYVYLLFCYFLFVRLNEWRFSGKLNSYLNKIKKGKLKEFAL